MKKLSLILVILLTLVVAAPVTSTFASTEPSKTSEQTVTEKININVASKIELTQLPGIGPKTADKILSYRKENGKFQKVEDLLNVKGIGEKKLSKIKPLVTL